ncbi:hypothetical protein [Paraburkholderia sp. ZP32-5]|uniref:hypothetical protein n=1 Tax=Paraburkholderia sp. ZP32-5 TaxID=2883245 RepID=UPI001F254E95|nr:hypothetical protein [Paraburkholderia sp. ZP32-5]
MQQYVFSMTSRMVTIAATCALLLCVLLFLLGVEIGSRFAAPDTPPASAAPASVSTGSVAPQNSPDAGSASAAAPASSTL